MLDERGLLIVTGKGGVGKSAVSASLALRAARGGRKVLAAAVVGGSGLAAHLGSPVPGHAAHRVRPGLWTMTVTPGDALEEYLRRQVHLPAIGPAGHGLRALAETVPGIRDVVTIGKVLYEVRSGAWDVVVLDAPPAGQVTSLLRAPTTVEGLVPSGRVEAEASWMREVLGDRAVTRLVVVATPEELAVAEAVETIAAAADLVGGTDTVVNRVLAPPGYRAAEARRTGGPVGAAALHHLAVAAAQRPWLDALPATVALPALLGVMTPVEVAARLCDHLGPS